MIHSLLAFTPILTCSGLVLLFRRTAVTAALSGLTLALVICTFSDAFKLDLAAARTAALSALILTLSAVLVIGPGLYLNAILRGRRIIDGLVQWIDALPMAPPHKVLMLILGFLPMVESLTGFGVSLFLAVPIFFKMFPAGRAYRLSVLSMNIMPWGTLALATMIGAALSMTSPTSLGIATALQSFLVFPCIGVLALGVLGNRRASLMAILPGFGLSLLLVAGCSLGLTEIAGIVAGATVGTTIILAAHRRTAGGPPWRLLSPYAAVLGIILVTRLVPPLHAWLVGAWVLSTANVHLSVLASPGLALAVVAMLQQWHSPVVIDHRAVWTKARAAAAALACYSLLAQVMLVSGMIAAIPALLDGRNGALLYVLSPLLGMMSGFLTGSNVGGNALLMPMQYQIGSRAGHSLLLAAAQNSGAGHAVFASLPIIILVMTIARDCTDDRAVREHDLLAFGLKAAAPVFAALVAVCALLGNLPGLPQQLLLVAGN